MDGSQKLPQRILGTLADNRAAGRPSPGLTLAVAAWMRYVGGDRRARAADRRPRPAGRPAPALVGRRRVTRGEGRGVAIGPRDFPRGLRGRRSSQGRPDRRLRAAAGARRAGRRRNPRRVGGFLEAFRELHACKQHCMTPARRPPPSLSRTRHPPAKRAAARPRAAEKRPPGGAVGRCPGSGPGRDGSAGALPAGGVCETRNGPAALKSRSGRRDPCCRSARTCPRPRRCRRR